jgi:hypothetical protein
MPLSLRASIPLIATVAAVAGGCSAPVVDDVADASGAMTEGVVLVERTVAVDGAVQTSVSAKFMRLSTPADPDLAERMVGTKLDQPSVGACRRLATETVNSKTRAWNQLGTIELIDVGDVTLRTRTRTRTSPESDAMPLAVRAFPDVGDFVSGMFYTSRDAASDLPAAATYTLEGTGSALVDRFVVEADAPAAPEDVRVGGATLADGPTLEEAQAPTVRWRAVAPRDPQAPRDLVLVDVSAASGASIRCAFRDSGAAQLPGWILGAAVLGPLPASATISVHRVRESAFVAPGLDVGAMRFDLSVVGHATVIAKAPSVTAAAQPQP